jgi:hypothetical protein
VWAAPYPAASLLAALLRRRHLVAHARHTLPVELPTIVGA